tara:strand:+ start:8085 stop:10124 length:2040 start_codon:yes stop_codon:yes gene_type:complete
MSNNKLNILKRPAIAGPVNIVRNLLLMSVLMVGVSCVSSEVTHEEPLAEELTSTLLPVTELQHPDRDPRVGLSPGLFDAEEAIWNLNLITNVIPPDNFIGSWSTDLAFKDNYAIQGNYNGFIVWDISDFANPKLVIDYLCPASQSDVSIYQNLLFVSGEGTGGRLDCGTEGVATSVSDERLRGIRIFDISDIKNPEYVSNVQTCRGSHTHSVLVDPNDDENVFVYVSGSAPVRPEEELPGCVSALPDEDPNSALFRIEVIQVPLANPEQAAIVTSPRIFEGLQAPPRHGLAPEELAVVEQAREAGRYVADYMDQPRIVSDGLVRLFLGQIVEERGGSGDATAADSLALRNQISDRYSSWMDERLAQRGRGADLGPNQCHDITLYPEAGLAGGACEGYGLLLDITDPINPVRIDAVADSNFAYWHSATFNNDGTTVIFTDEWGGGTQAKCRDTDPYEWGANAIYSIKDGKMNFESYFKMPAPQTNSENCVAHNGSIVPVPGRDIMVQGWYQGGINVFDFTDPANPVEIAFHDRGPISVDRRETGGSWSVYWYNGALVNSEITRGLDIFELIPSEYITQNEIDASNTVELDYLNAQGQPMFVWPSTYSLAVAYLDQLERNRELDLENISMIRSGLEVAQNGANSDALTDLASQVRILAEYSSNQSKMMKLADVLDDLGNGV